MIASTSVARWTWGRDDDSAGALVRRLRDLSAAYQVLAVHRFAVDAPTIHVPVSGAGTSNSPLFDRDPAVPTSAREAASFEPLDVGDDATYRAGLAWLERLRAAHGPRLSAQDATVNEAGLDYRVVMASDATGRRRVLRVPRRADVSEGMAAERRILGLVAPVLAEYGVAVPDWRVHSPEPIACPALPGAQGMQGKQGTSRTSVRSSRR